MQEKRLAKLILLAGFNVKIAPRLGIEPITAAELEACLLADAPKEADAIASHARAQAELDFGNRHSAYPLLAKVLRGYESKAKESFRQVAADYRASHASRTASRNASAPLPL